MKRKSFVRLCFTELFNVISCTFFLFVFSPNSFDIEIHDTFGVKLKLKIDFHWKSLLEEDFKGLLFAAWITVCLYFSCSKSLLFYFDVSITIYGSIKNSSDEWNGTLLICDVVQLKNSLWAMVFFIKHQLQVNR